MGRRGVAVLCALLSAVLVLGIGCVPDARADTGLVVEWHTDDVQVGNPYRAAHAPTSRFLPFSELDAKPRAQKPRAHA